MYGSHSLTYSLTDSVTHSPIHSLPHSLTYSCITLHFFPHAVWTAALLVAYVFHVSSLSVSALSALLCDIVSACPVVPWPWHVCAEQVAQCGMYTTVRILIHSLDSLTYSTRSLTRSLTHSFTQSLTHSLIHFLNQSMNQSMNE